MTARLLHTRFGEVFNKRKSTIMQPFTTEGPKIDMKAETKNLPPTLIHYPPPKKKAKLVPNSDSRKKNNPKTNQFPPNYNKHEKSRLERPYFQCYQHRGLEQLKLPPSITVQLGLISYSSKVWAAKTFARRWHHQQTVKTSRLNKREKWEVKIHQPTTPIFRKTQVFPHPHP